MPAINATLKWHRAEAGFLTVPDAAKLVHRPTSTVRHWCSKKLVACFKDGGIWFASKTDVLKRAGNEKGKTSCE